MQYLHTRMVQVSGSREQCVSHVGHCNPHVVRDRDRWHFEHKQQVGTGEYLADNASTLPESLAVGFLVNSGSEANELAVRLAIIHRNDMAVIEGAYHGHREC